MLQTDSLKLQLFEFLFKEVIVLKINSCSREKENTELWKKSEMKEETDTEKLKTSPDGSITETF